jgi:hypothetical protein
MMLAVDFADFGFGTVVGAVIAGSVAIFLDQRRRNWERKNRWQEDKRHLYADFIEANWLIFQSSMTEAAFAIVHEKLEKRLDKHDIDDLTELGLMEELMKDAQRFGSRLEEIGSEGKLKELVKQLTLIGSNPIRQAADRLADLLYEIQDHLDAGEAEQALSLAKQYIEAHQRFSLLARRDLGIRV